MLMYFNHEIIVFCGLYKYYMSMLGNIASILSLHEVTTKYMVWYGSRYIGSVAYMAH